MRTEQSKTIYLKDYQAPDYLIDETHLTFELFEDHTLVPVSYTHLTLPTTPYV